MANDLAAVAGSTAVAKPLRRGGTKALVQQFRADLSSKVDLKPYERTLGTVVNPGLLKKKLGWDNYVLCVMNAQRKERENALGRQATIADIVGTPGNGTHFREVLGVLLATAITVGDRSVTLQVLLRPEHPVLAVLKAALEGGAKIIKEQESGDYEIPAFDVKGVGLDQMESGGHDPDIVAKVKGYVEAERQALPSQ